MSGEKAGWGGRDRPGSGLTQSLDQTSRPNEPVHSGCPFDSAIFMISGERRLCLCAQGAHSSAWRQANYASILLLSCAGKSIIIATEGWRQVAESRVVVFGSGGFEVHDGRYIGSSTHNHLQPQQKILPQHSQQWMMVRLQHQPRGRLDAHRTAPFMRLPAPPCRSSTLYTSVLPVPPRFRQLPAIAAFSLQLTPLRVGADYFVPLSSVG